MRKKFRMRCPTCDAVCNVVDGPPYPHYVCATHGALIIASPVDATKRDALASAERAVVKAAMAAWRARQGWMDDAKCREAQALDVASNAACAALAKLEE